MGRTICVYVSLACVILAVAHAKNVQVKRVTEPYGLSEGPHWDHRTQKLYFVDIYNQYIRRLDVATGVVTSTYINHGPVSVVVPVDDSTDEFVAGSGRDVILVTWNGTENLSNTKPKVLTTVDLTHTNTRTNDGKADSSGRLWIGTMGDEIDGQPSPPNLGLLSRIDDEMKHVVEISPVSISNGLAWNIQDDTFYYIDSPTRVIAAYDYDPINGKISNRRVVFDLNDTDLSGVPDGMTIDTDGNLWIALFGGHHIINVNPKTKQLLRKIKLPAENVTSAAFGGPLLDILYVTTSGHGLTAEQRKETPYAGSVFAIEGLGVHGLIANSFKISDLKQK